MFLFDLFEFLRLKVEAVLEFSPSVGVFLFLQAVLAGAAPPPGQLCREAAGADAPLVVLQAGGAGEDPAGHAEAERRAAAPAS